MPAFRKSSVSRNEFFGDKHRFEHWYRDNTVCLITARCRGRFPAFKDELAKTIFWQKLDQYASQHGFSPWITSLLDNHYHLVGHLTQGDQLGPMMRKLHGSAAKLVNDQLPVRLLPFWYDAGRQSYFDGCLRNETQLQRTYRYVLRQSVRHGITRDPALYAHTQAKLSLENAMSFAKTQRCYLNEVPYARYEPETKRSPRKDAQPG